MKWELENQTNDRRIWRKQYKGRLIRKVEFYTGTRWKTEFFTSGKNIYRNWLEVTKQI